MSLGDSIKTALETDTALMALLTGGIHTGIEEISRYQPAAAFDANKEILPCALIKEGVEMPLRSGYRRAVNQPFTIYFYQRQGYDVIGPAMDLAYNDLNEQKIVSGVWNIEFDIRVNQQRDTALDCALGSLRFVAKRLR